MGRKAKKKPQQYELTGLPHNLLVAFRISGGFRPQDKVTAADIQDMLLLTRWVAYVPYVTAEQVEARFPYLFENREPGFEDPTFVRDNLITTFAENRADADKALSEYCEAEHADRLPFL